MAMIKMGSPKNSLRTERVPMQRKYIVWLKSVCLKMMT